MKYKYKYKSRIIDDPLDLHYNHFISDNDNQLCYLTSDVSNKSLILSFHQITWDNKIRIHNIMFKYNFGILNYICIYIMYFSSVTKCIYNLRTGMLVENQIQPLVNALSYGIFKFVWNSRWLFRSNLSQLNCIFNGWRNYFLPY